MAATWHQIRDILDAVLQIPPEERPRYLDQAGLEPELRRHIDSLLVSYEGADGFLERPAIHQHSGHWGTMDSSMPFAAGTKLGPYQIVSLLGAGGMGEVYRAYDERLHRDVAIKILHPAVGDDLQGRKRLLDEARSASQLNHPHICTIYEVGEENGVTFIAMEYVAGRA
ncbi:MAG: protein kinase, partial [Acidobacteriaceae bacterium]|nr:protein kinase [Acidobacteriaceae bacterium]